MNAIKISVQKDEQKGREPVLINLDLVISVKLITGFSGKPWLNILATGQGNEGIIGYQITDPGYAQYLFDALSDQAVDYSWEYYLQQIKK
jgi:hypothetical protein